MDFCHCLDVLECAAAGSRLDTADSSCPFTTVELLAEVVGADDDMLSLEVTDLVLLALDSGCSFLLR